MAHYIESAGIATTGISLVRENTVAIRPPRALWVPFDLGRPFGAPHEPAFQTDVLRSVLALLERTDGPVILDDYPHDAPGQGSPEAMEGMTCPVRLPRPSSDAPAGLLTEVQAEIAALRPWHDLFRERRGGSAVGLAGIPVSDAAAFLAELYGSGQASSVPEEQWGDMLRFASQDLHDYYVEAAAMRPGGAAGPVELENWFWGETSAGRLLLDLKMQLVNHENEGVRRVATTQIVPRAQRHRLGVSK